MKYSFYSLFILCAFVFFSCDTTKKSQVPDTPLPEWVKTRPVSNMYYIGVSSASKTGQAPAAYMQAAKQNALNDLASDISVSISSSSVISTNELGEDLQNQFSRMIKASTSKYLEGYELVDTYEDEYNYYVYYRLSKAKYREIKARKKQNTLNNALAKYSEAKEMHKKSDYYNAISYYINSLEVLTPYLGETNEVKYASDTIDIGNAIFSDLQSLLGKMEIRPVHQKITVNNAVPFTSNLIDFKITGPSRRPVKNIPIEWSFSGAGLINPHTESTQDGIIHFPMNCIHSAKSVEQIGVRVDMDEIAKKAKDIIVRNLIREMPAPSYRMNVEITPPSFFVESNEQILGAAANTSILKNAFIEAMSDENIRLSDSKNTADYSISIDANTKKAYVNMGQYTAGLSMRIRVSDSNKRIVYNKERDHIEGSGTNYKNASKDAYQNAANFIIRRSFNNIKRTIF